MKAIDSPFTKIINGTTQFVIPVFQRDYSWTESHCDQLWQDIVRVAADPDNRGHFIGSVVYVSTGDSSAGFTKWMLVDGQQRVTTLTLLIAALRDHIEKTGWSGSENGPTANRLDAYFLKNLQEEGARRNKLVLRGWDQETLRSIIDRQELPNEPSERIRDNYEYFREKLGSADPETVYRGIGRLVVVDVTLDRVSGDPQLIFESLNSTGLDLSQSDLIRNFILMRLPEKEQTRLYETYWRKVEDLFRGSERAFDAFVRDYLALRTSASKQEKADEIYFAFRREFGGIGCDVATLDEVLQELLRFARYHAAFSTGADCLPRLREPLARLRRLVDVPATVVMRLFDYLDRDEQTAIDEFVEAIELLESYVFRRAICGEQTRGYWQVFANLAYRVDKQDPLRSLKVGLALLPETYRFPDCSEFRKALEENDVYNKRVCKELLDRLENHGSREPSDTSGYSIEHIMPQNEKLSQEWRQMLGEGWQDVQREWLHRLGNLTLSGYNSTYSDRSFEEKKSIAGGFGESSVRLNKFVREQENWTAREMELRGRELAERALDVWPALRVEGRFIEEAREAALKERAARRDVSKVPMSAAAQELVEALGERIRALDAGVIEVAERRSVSYHGPAFFLEVLPRKNRVVLLLPLEFNEVTDPSGLARDTTQWKFLVNAAYEGGVHASVKSVADIDSVMPMVRQAHEVSRA